MSRDCRAASTIGSAPGPLADARLRTTFVDVGGTRATMPTAQADPTRPVADAHRTVYRISALNGAARRALTGSAASRPAGHQRDASMSRAQVDRPRRGGSRIRCHAKRPTSDHGQGDVAPASWPSKAARPAVAEIELLETEKARSERRRGTRICHGSAAPCVRGRGRPGGRRGGSSDRGRRCGRPAPISCRPSCRRSRRSGSGYGCRARSGRRRVRLGFVGRRCHPARWGRAWTRAARYPQP